MVRKIDEKMIARDQVVYFISPSSRRPPDPFPPAAGGPDFHLPLLISFGFLDFSSKNAGSPDFACADVHKDWLE